VSGSPFSVAAALGAFIFVAIPTTGCGDGTRGTVLRIPNPAQPKLLYTPSEEPTGIAGLTYLRDHIEEIEQGPFDGITVDVGLGDAPWGTVRYTRSQFDAEVEMLRSTPFRKLTDNFEMFNARTGGIDWFDDQTFGVVIGNARVAAEVVRDAGLKGLFLDVEQYDEAVWSYPDPPDPARLPQFEAQAHLRGAQFMDALLDVKPDIAILLTVATSEVFRSVCVEGVAWAEDRYRLLPAFIDGMFEAKAARGASALIVDGFLGSYAAHDPRAFAVFRELVQGNWAGVSERWFSGIESYRFGRGRIAWDDEPTLKCTTEVRDKLTRDLPTGFGLMLDFDTVIDMDFHSDPADFDLNFFTPQDLEVTLAAALGAAERYVYLWSGTMDWIGVSSQPRPPREYVDAATRARLGRP
jgi:hypothetical protein